MAVEARDMRILLACELFYPSVGGVQEVMRQLGERLAQLGHDVSVATTYLAERQSASAFGIKVVQFKISGNLVNGMAGEVERYRDFVLRQDYDILLIKAVQQWTFDALVPVLQDVRKPKILIPCGFSGLFDPRYSDYFAAMPGWLRKFDRLIFYASQYRDIDMARKHGLTNLRIVPNGADEREFNVARDSSFRARYGVPDNAFVVMTVGSITGLKGHAELACAFERACFFGRDACLLLIGNTPRVPLSWRLRLEQLHQREGFIGVARGVLGAMMRRIGIASLLGRRVRSAHDAIEQAVLRINKNKNRKAILLDIPRAEVIQAYLNSDLFVLASKIEYSPLVLFEAAAAGLPFLAVPVGNAREIVEWTGGGVICDAPVTADGYTEVDPSQLARHIETLANQPGKLTQLGSNGRRSWQRTYTWSTIVRSYETIFKECAEKA